MANGETASDLKKEVLDRCGEKDDGTSGFDATALSYINKAQQKIIAGSSEFELDIGEPWPWAISPNKVTVTNLAYVGTNYTSSLTVDFTFNSATGTFSQAPQYPTGTNVSLKGWWVQTTAASEWYLITAHTAGQTTFTIDTPFNGWQGAANSEVLAILLDYTLQAANPNGTEPGGIQRLAGPGICYLQQSYDNDNEYRVYQSDIREFQRQYPLSVIEMGMPTRFCITSINNGTTDSQQLNIRFNKYNDQQSRIDFSYIAVPLDLTSNPDSIPIIPREFRDVLVYIACWWLLRDKADDRQDSYKQDAQNVLKAMIMDARKKRDHTQKQKAALIPRWDNINQKKRITYL